MASTVATESVLVARRRLPDFVEGAAVMDKRNGTPTVKGANGPDDKGNGTTHKAAKLPTKKK